MPRPERRRRPIDWPAWIALAWASWTGLLYGRMTLEARAPRLLAAIERTLGSTGRDAATPIAEDSSEIRTSESSRLSRLGPSRGVSEAP